jgi:hypothetical protein
VVNALVNRNGRRDVGKGTRTLTGCRIPRECSSPTPPRPGTRGQGIREGKDTKDSAPVRVSFCLLLVSPGQPGFVDTKDTKDSFYARPVEAVPLVDDPGAV